MLGSGHVFQLLEKRGLVSQRNVGTFAPHNYGLDLISETL